MNSNFTNSTQISGGEKRTLLIALTLNFLMFIIGIVAAVKADSTALMADSFDMLADASGYGVSFLAVGQTLLFKRGAARWNGAMLGILGIGVIAEVVWRYFGGSAPQGPWIIAYSILSLAVNVSVLRMLIRHRHGEIHMRASWIDTRADVIVNVGVLLSGVAIAVTGWRYIDLMVGLAIAVFVIGEAMEIFREASE